MRARNQKLRLQNSGSQLVLPFRIRGNKVPQNSDAWKTPQRWADLLTWRSALQSKVLRPHESLALGLRIPHTDSKLPGDYNDSRILRNGLEKNLNIENPTVVCNDLQLLGQKFLLDSGRRRGKLIHQIPALANSKRNIVSQRTPPTVGKPNVQPRALR